MFTRTVTTSSSFVIIVRHIEVFFGGLLGRAAPAGGASGQLGRAGLPKICISENYVRHFCCTVWLK